MRLSIEKREQDTEKEMYDVLNVIFRKPHNGLTKEDKAFLQARRSYLTAAQTTEYSEELSEDLNQNLDDLDLLTRKELNAKAIALGVGEPDKMPNRQAVIDAINEVKE